jgi:hypothetical protein
MGEGSEPPYGEHQRTDELLVEQDPFQIERPLLFRRERNTGRGRTAAETCCAWG